MRPENKLMVAFLKANGIVATVKYCREGSMRGCWYLWSPTLSWDEVMREKLTAIGFNDFDGRPLSRYSGNAGMFSVQVRGHAEFVAQAREETVKCLNVALSDGGRKEHGFKERGDCSVRAAAHALGIPYPDAHAKLKALGRKNRAGFNLYQPDRCRALGLSRRDCACGMMVKDVLPTLDGGRHIIEVSHHFFAVVDGKVFDSFIPNPRQHVRRIYTVNQQEKP
jgi:hypothetical protein